ncbi:conserved hypothetical protein [Shewanella sediminis HAW-EB3]|uniref:DUF805 domain-containing protein n=1 Tax=Shewanella sediminis (strain HAW-EB3) TaxID=425104 RepID=A8FQ27_SHESH|nr:DUF805 domain-containing protein [Shewanella sediminis]ABV34950.1 conserved hypothetical protein [Shewanella sediminis HAW-EB3]
MQYRSLFCVRGRDNGPRFALISALAYLILLLGFIFIGASSALIIIGLFLTPLLGLSGLRRMRDAARPAWLLGLSFIPLLFFVLSLVYGDSLSFSASCVVFATLITGFLAMQRSASKNSHYHQGYSGPAAMTAGGKGRKRVEPTLDGSAAPVGGHISDNMSEQVEEPESYEETGRGFDGISLEQWSSWAKQNRRLLLASVGGLSCMILIAGVWSLFSGAAGDEDVAQEPEVSAPQIIVKRDEVKLPDGFSLILEHDLLVMRWLGETEEPGTIWSLATAQGDKTCAHLIFNNGTRYRPVTVEQMPDTGIEARFSPLDTESIISDIARRGSVKLCGYDFSLKGSQSALAKSGSFIPYL